MSLLLFIILFIRIIDCSSDSKQLSFFSPRFTLTSRLLRNRTLFFLVFYLCFFFSLHLSCFTLNTVTLLVLHSHLCCLNCATFPPHTTGQRAHTDQIVQCSFSARPGKVPHLCRPVVQVTLYLQILDQCLCKFLVLQYYLYV